MPRKIRVTILDNHQSIVDGYLYRLSQKPQIEVVATLGFGGELEATLAEHPTDVLLLEFGIPTGPLDRDLYPILTLIPKLLQLYPDLDILVVSTFADRGIIKAVMEAGASGYILKDDSPAIRDLGNIVLSVADGGIYLSQNVGKVYQEQEPLTHCQIEALTLCAAFPKSKTNDLARMMTMSNSAVRNLLSGAFMTLGVNTRAAAIARAYQLGLLSTNIPTVPRVS